MKTFTTVSVLLVLLAISGTALGHDYSTKFTRTSCGGDCSATSRYKKVETTTTDYEGYFSASCLCHKHRFDGSEKGGSLSCACSKPRSSLEGLIGASIRTILWKDEEAACEHVTKANLQRRAALTEVPLSEAYLQQLTATTEIPLNLRL